MSRSKWKPILNDNIFIKENEKMPRSFLVQHAHIGHSFLVSDGKNWKKIALNGKNACKSKFGEFIYTRKKPAFKQKVKELKKKK